MTKQALLVLVLAAAPAWGADLYEKAEAASPFGRICKPYDAAHFTAFLLSDESGVMTGGVYDLAHRVVQFPRID